MASVNPFQEHTDDYHFKYDDQNIILMGYLLKKNWYGNKQRRFFIFRNNGQVEYFENSDLKSYKGVFQLIK